MLPSLLVQQFTFAEIQVTVLVSCLPAFCALEAVSIMLNSGK